MQKIQSAHSLDILGHGVIESLVRCKQFNILLGFDKRLRIDYWSAKSQKILGIPPKEGVRGGVTKLH